MKRRYIVSAEGLRTRTFATLEAARKAARKASNELKCEVEIYYAVREVPSGWRLLERVAPVHRRDLDLRADVEMARQIGLEF